MILGVLAAAFGMFSKQLVLVDRVERVSAAR